MNKWFNRQMNKTEYFFNEKEKTVIVNILIQKKFFWYVKDFVFRLQRNYKSTSIEIYVNSCTVLIQNDSEVAKIVLDKNLYQSLLLGIQDMVVEG